MGDRQPAAEGHSLLRSTAVSVQLVRRPKEGDGSLGRTEAGVQARGREGASAQPAFSSRKPAARPWAQGWPFAALLPS